jgi:prevent-host-death family protein
MVFRFFVNSTYTISSGQREFPAMVKRAEKGELAVVTRHDKPVAYVVSAERMESMLETMELLANPGFMRALEADRKGKTTYHDLDSISDD